MALFVPKDRKSLFRQFLAGMYDAVVITDPNGHVIEINPRAVEHFGYTQEEVLDRHISRYIPGLTAEVVQRIRRGLAEDRHLVIDANGLAKDGRKVACEVTISVVDLVTPDDLVFTIRNVERRRELMNAFRAKANAFELAHTALFGCDREWNIRDCNREFCDLFGLKDVNEARTHIFTDLMGDEPLPERFEAALNGETTTTTITADAEDGEKVELEIILGPNMHARRNHGVVGSIRKF